MTTSDLRHKYIFEKISKESLVSVIDLALSLDVSEMTIRRDLNELERIDHIRRVHGGAISARGRSYEPPLAVRRMDDALIKQTMICNAKEVAMVLDSSKLEKVAFAHVASFDVIQQLITDAVPPPPLLDALKNADVVIHVVGDESTRIL